MLIREPPLFDEVLLDADPGGLVERAVKQQHLGNATVPTASRQKSIRGEVEAAPGLSLMLVTRPSRPMGNGV